MFYNKNTTILFSDVQDDVIVERLRVVFDNFTDAQAWSEQRMAYTGVAEIAFAVEDGKLIHEYTNSIEIAALEADMQCHEAAVAQDIYDARQPWH